MHAAALGQHGMAHVGRGIAADVIRHIRPGRANGRRPSAEMAQPAQSHAM